MPFHRTVAVLTATAMSTGALAAAAPAAFAVQARHSSTVSTVPATGTPQVENGTINDIVQIGSTVVVGGSFTSVVSEDTGATVDTRYAMAFDAATGAVHSAFRPRLDDGGTVNVVRPGPVNGTVYLGGDFDSVDGVAAKGLALVSLADGSLVPGFTPSLVGGNVNALERVGSRLYVGGTFSKVGSTSRVGIATLSATTGALDPFLGSSVAVNHNWTPTSPPEYTRGAVGVTDLDITPDGNKLVAIGNFKQVDGRSLDQIAMWDLSGSAAVLRDWRTTRLADACRVKKYDSWVRDVDFSPDGSYFVLVTVGGYDPASLCDTATRWETSATGQDVRPTWIASSGGDSLMSTAITGAAVYVGGHQRWLNNATAKDRPGGGAIPRPGVVALDPVTGLPLAWNPGRHPRGVGTAALYATPEGLWMGSDTETIGVGTTRTTRKRLVFFPVAGGTLRGTSVPTLPGGVYSGPPVPATSSSAVLHRINAGGPALLPIDGGPEWAADLATTSPYRADSESNLAPSTPYTLPIPKLDSTVPLSTTPAAVFADHRQDLGNKGDGKEVLWRLPVTKGTSVAVRLFFATRSSSYAVTGKRVFDIRIDSVLKADNFDIYQAAGDQTGTMRSYTVTSDGTIDVQLTHEVSHPVVAAIEVVVSGATTPSVPYGQLSGRSFDGTTAGGSMSTTSTVDANGVRGAVMIGGSLFYGKANGHLYRREVSGGTWSSPARVDPYNDPTWSDVDTGSNTSSGADILYRGTRPTFYDDLTNITSMLYDPRTSRLYYTMHKQSTLFYRPFSPDSGAVHHDRSTVPGVVLPTDLVGAFVDRGSLYYARSSTSSLTKVGFTWTALTGTPVSIPAPSGGDWRSRALFIGPEPS